MNVVLWILQGLLAVAFLGSGVMKVSRPKEKLAANMGWVDSFPASGVKAIGAAEALGGLGLILPAATGIAAPLTPIAAVGLAITMVGALVTHGMRGDRANEFVPAAVLLVLAALIAWGRFGPYHF